MNDTTPHFLSRRSARSWFLFNFLFFSSVILLLVYGEPQQAGSAAAAVAQKGGDELNVDLKLHVAPGQLEAPVDIAHAGDSRLFVVERAGRIRVVLPDGSVQPQAFLDISDRVLVQERTELGLLGLAFDPNYEENGAFYVNYTARPQGHTHISRFRVNENANVADAGSEEIVLRVKQPSNAHNGGDLLFGPHDGYLYIPLGDGGGYRDPNNNAQRRDVLLGKVLRIDVDVTSGGEAPDCGEVGNYRVPTDNPFVDGAGGFCDETWALGLRNPWRASFDRETHDLYIGDVGQDLREEINFQAAGDGGGQNYGWRCYEGAEPISTEPQCRFAGIDFVPPIFEYSHDEQAICAVTGGYVYRGYRFPQLRGFYFFSDFCSGHLWHLEKGSTWLPRRYYHLQSMLAISATFGEDVFGELYVANMGSGAIYRLVEDTLATDVEPGLFLPFTAN